jgi:small GTP-binding protein
MFSFNKEADYIRTVDQTKTLLKEQIGYFSGMAKPLDTQKLEDMMAQIDSPFMMLVCGEYNSGKSTFINSLLGDKICNIGSTPTTDKINIIKNGYSDVEKIKSPIVNVMDIDLEMLQNFLIVDTPGTNSIVKEHQEITLKFIHRAELILFVTSADRPFSESERQMLELISSKYGKKIVFILNKIDQKEKEDVDEIMKYIEDNSVKLLDFRPTILTISSKKAFEGISKDDNSLIKESNLNYVIDRINQIYKRNALYLKLDSPLSTSLKLLDQVKDQIDIDNDAIEKEVRELEQFQIRLGKYQEELINDYTEKVKLIKGNFSEIENDMYKVIDSITFMQLLKSKLPFTKHKIKYDFESQFTDLAKKINGLLENLTYEVAKDSKKFYEQAEQFIREQMDKYKRKDMYIQTASPDYIEKGKNILNTLRASFESDYQQLNLPQESKNIKKSIDDGFAGSLIGSVASLGVGGVLLATLPTALLDIVGLSISIVLAMSSLFILPVKKKRAKRVLSDKFDELSDKLSTITLEKIKEDIIAIHTQINRDLKPYRSFTQSEKEIIGNNWKKAEELKKRTQDIKNDVETRFKKRWSGI